MRYNFPVVCLRNLFYCLKEIDIFEVDSRELLKILTLKTLRKHFSKH